jgi:hypothetical protein
MAPSTRAGAPSLLLLLTLVGGPALAAPVPAPAPVPSGPVAAPVPADEAADEAASVDDPQARAVLQRMADFLARQRKATVTVRASYDVVQPDGEKLEFGEVRHVTLQRPDKVRVDAVGTDGRRHEVVFDGRTISVADPDQDAYTQIPMQGDLDQALTRFTEDLGMRFPLKELVSTRLPEHLRQLVTSARFVGTAVIDGKAYDQVAARGPEADFQVWVPQEGDPLPLRLVITYRDEPGAPQYRATFRRWDAHPELPRDAFTFEPPPGAQRLAVIAPPQVPIEGGEP